LTISEKAGIMQELGAIDGGSINIQPTIEEAFQILQQIPSSEINADMDRLAGKLLFDKGNFLLETNKLQESEQMFIEAAERLAKSHKAQHDDENTFKLLESVNQVLSSGEKQRNRYGKAIYHYCGDFVKEGGGYKTWKKRFFVVDDTSIAYFKHKRDWESVAVQGSKGKPNGRISFAEIYELSSHDPHMECPLIKFSARPTKLKCSGCIHLHTRDRIYNILTVPDQINTAKDLANILKGVVRSYKAKKDVKMITKKKTNILDLIDNTNNNNLVVNVKHLTADTSGSILSNSKGKYPSDKLLSKKSINWKDTDDEKLAEYIPRGKSQYPDEPWSDNDDGEEEESFEDMKSEDNKGEFEEITYDKLKDKLREMNEEKRTKLMKKILKEYEKEGKLVGFILALMEEDSQKYLLKLSGVDNFQIAKFGALQKMSSFLHTPNAL